MLNKKNIVISCVLVLTVVIASIVTANDNLRGYITQIPNFMPTLSVRNVDGTQTESEPDAQLESEGAVTAVQTVSQNNSALPTVEPVLNMSDPQSYPGGFRVSINGTVVTEENMADVFNDNTVSYDPTTCTLQLNSAYIIKDSSLTGYDALIQAEGSINIVLQGINTLTNPNDVDGGTIIELENSANELLTLTIKGESGSVLTVNSKDGIYAPNVVFEGEGTVNFSFEDSNYYPGSFIYLNHGVKDSNLVINDPTGNITLNDNIQVSATGYGALVGDVILNNSSSFELLGDIGGLFPSNGINGDVTLSDSSNLTVETLRGDAISGDVTMNSTGTLEASGADWNANDVGNGISGTLTQTAGTINVRGGDASTSSGVNSLAGYGIEVPWDSTLEFPIHISGGTLNVWGGNNTGVMENYGAPTTYSLNYGIGISAYQKSVKVSGEGILNAYSGTPSEIYIDKSMLQLYPLDIPTIECDELIVEGSANVTAISYVRHGIMGNLVMNSTGSVTVKGGDAVNSPYGEGGDGLLNGVLTQTSGTVTIRGGDANPDSTVISQPGIGIMVDPYSSITDPVQVSGGTLNVYGGNNIGTLTTYDDNEILYLVNACGIISGGNPVKATGTGTINAYTGLPSEVLVDESKIYRYWTDTSAIACSDLIVEDSASVNAIAYIGYGISGDLLMNSSGSVTAEGGDAVNNYYGIAGGGMQGTVTQSAGTVTIRGGDASADTSEKSKPGNGINYYYTPEPLTIVTMTGGVLNVHGGDNVGFHDAEIFYPGQENKLQLFIGNGFSPHFMSGMYVTIKLSGDAVLNAYTGNPNGMKEPSEGYAETYYQAPMAITTGDLIVEGTASVNATAYWGTAIRSVNEIQMHSSGTITAKGGDAANDPRLVEVVRGDVGIYGGVITQTAGTITAKGGDALLSNSQFSVPGDGIVVGVVDGNAIDLSGGTLNATGGDNVGVIRYYSENDERTGDVGVGIDVYNYKIRVSGGTLNVSTGDVGDSYATIPNLVYFTPFTSALKAQELYVTGTGSVTATATAGKAITSNVIVSGDGAVTATGGVQYFSDYLDELTTDMRPHGIYGSVTQNGGTVIAIGGSGTKAKHVSGDGIALRTSNDPTGTVIRSGTLTAIGGDDMDLYDISSGISGALSIFDGTVTATGGSSFNSYSTSGGNGFKHNYGEFNIYGGTMIAMGGTSAVNNSISALNAIPYVTTNPSKIIEVTAGPTEAEAVNVSFNAEEITTANFVKYLATPTEIITYDILLNGEWLTSINYETISVDSGTLTFTPADKENGTNSKFTFDNVTFNSTVSEDFIAIDSYIGNLDIELIGDNTLNLLSSAFYDKYKNSINFIGEGTLTVTAGSSAIAFDTDITTYNDKVAVTVTGGTEGGDAVRGAVTINDEATLTAQGGSSTNNSVNGGHAIEGDLVMNSTGTVTLTGGTAVSGMGGSGLYGTIMQSSGIVNAYGADNVEGNGEFHMVSSTAPAIRLFRNISFRSEISGGTLTAVGGSDINAPNTSDVGSDAILSFAHIDKEYHYFSLEAIAVGHIVATGGDAHYNNSHSGVYGGNGIAVMGFHIRDDAAVEATGGSVTTSDITKAANSGSGVYMGDSLYFSTNISISGSASLTATGGNSNGVYMPTHENDDHFGGTGIKGDASVQAGTVIAIGGTYTGDDSVGAYGYYGSLTAYGSSFITATGGNGDTSGGHAIYGNYGQFDNSVLHKLSFWNNTVEAIGGSNTAGITAPAIGNAIPDFEHYIYPSPSFLYGDNKADAEENKETTEMPNFGDNFTAGYLKIAPSLMEITSDPITGTYGDIVQEPIQTKERTPGAGTFEYSSTNENAATVDENGTITLQNVGTAYIRVSYIMNGYVAESDVLQVTVTPKTLTVTPNAQTKFFSGDIDNPNPDPIFTYTLDGLVNGDSILRGTNISRNEGESVGEYAYNLGDLTAGDNYNLVLADNAPKFTIKSRETQDLTVSIPTTANYGDVLDQLEPYTTKTGDSKYFYSSSNGEVATISNLGEINIVGVGVTTITVKELGDASYAPAEVTGTLTVGKKDLTDSLNIAVTGTYTYTGEPIIPNLVVKADGVVLREGVDYTLDYANNTNAGEATVTVTPIEGDSKRYTWTAKQTSFTIEKAALPINDSFAFTVFLDENTKTITATDLGLPSGATIGSATTYNDYNLSAFAYTNNEITFKTILATESIPLIMPALINATIASNNNNLNDKNIIINVIVTEKNPVPVTISMPDYTYGDIIGEPAVTLNGSAVTDITGNWSFSYGGTNFDPSSSEHMGAKPTVPGIYTVTVTYDGDTTVGTASATFTIHKKELGITSNTQYTKEFDGTTTVSGFDVAHLSVTNLTYSDSVEMNRDTLEVLAPYYTSPNKTADNSTSEIILDIISMELTGADSWKYTVPSQATLAGTITVPPLVLNSETNTPTSESVIPVTTNEETAYAGTITIKPISEAIGAGDYTSDMTAGYSSAEAIENALRVTAGLGSGDTEVVQMDISATHLPVTVLIPYPAGTDQNTVFSVKHMLSDGSIVEEPIEKTAEGIKLTLTSTSPLSLSYAQAQASVQMSGLPTGVDASLSLSDGSGTPITSKIQNLSSVTFTDVPAGTYTLTLKKAGYLDYTVTNIVVGESGEVNLGAITMIHGDVNGDGKVNFADLSTLRNSMYYGKSTSELSDDIKAVLTLDLNEFGTVDIEDLKIVLANYNKGASDSTIVFN